MLDQLFSAYVVAFAAMGFCAIVLFTEISLVRQGGHIGE
jgi:hypothetical protein